MSDRLITTGAFMFGVVVTIFIFLVSGGVC
jgi:hypothetical protein